MAGAGRTNDANLIGEVWAAADMVGPLQWNRLDHGGGCRHRRRSAGSALADNSADPFESLCAPVRRLHSRFKLALIHLGRRKGPEARLSLGLLVSQLCDLWQRETSTPVTANPIKLGDYTGRPQSASGRFVCAAVEALQPSAAWIDEHKAVEPHMRATIMMLPPGHRVQAVHSAMRAYVAADRPDPSAPRRGRPRRKAVQAFSNEDLERLTALLVLLSFGQCGVEKLDTEESLFNRVAADLGLALRDWWTPDEEFLALMRKDQLEAVAIESGASLRMGKLKDCSKKDLVSTLARYFERTADPTATLDEHDQRGRAWLPGAMSFPARAAVTMADHG